MQNLYNEEYYRHYRTGSGEISYQDSEELKVFIRHLASQIKEKYHPQTVLDAGCAMGMLVAALRDLGVEAYGVDLSEYAISQVREDIRPYCAVGSLSSALPVRCPNGTTWWCLWRCWSICQKKTPKKLLPIYVQ